MRGPSWERCSAAGSPDATLASGATLSAPLSADRRLALPLSLGAGLLVVPALAELGIQTRPLHLSLEPAQCAVETLVVLNDDFQAADPPRMNMSLKSYTGSDG